MPNHKTCARRILNALPFELVFVLSVVFEEEYSEIDFNKYTLGTHGRIYAPMCATHINCDAYQCQ